MLVVEKAGADAQHAQSNEYAISDDSGRVNRILGRVNRILGGRGGLIIIFMLVFVLALLLLLLLLLLLGTAEAKGSHKLSNTNCMMIPYI